MSKQDPVFLVGRLASRDKLNLAHHQMSVRAVAVQLKKIVQIGSDREKREGTDSKSLQVFDWI